MPRRKPTPRPKMPSSEGGVKVIDYLLDSYELLQDAFGKMEDARTESNQTNRPAILEHDWVSLSDKFYELVEEVESYLGMYDIEED